MEPTIYKPSIYKGAGIYKTGAGGGGGVNGFVIKNLWQIRACCNIDGFAFTPKGQQWASTISWSSRTKYNLNELSKIDIQLDALASWWNPDSVVFSYGSESSNYNTGRLFLMKIIEETVRVKELRCFVASSSSSWSMVHSQNIDVTKRHVFRVTLDFSKNEICFYLDGDIIHRQFITNYFTAFWCPGFATENYVIGETYPPSSYIEAANNTNKTLYLDNTYLKINDELIFGMEQ